MKSKQEICDEFGIEPAANFKKTVNRAIRTLPGGNELIEAITTENAALNHADRAGKNDRAIAIDSAINNLEEIYAAMRAHVVGDEK